MIYALTSFWLTVIVLMAWAVYVLWGKIVKPKAVNIALLPGTLVAQIGRIVGLLITGARINNTALMDDGDDGAPANDSQYTSKLPVFGPVIVGFLPLLATGLMTYVVLIGLGRPVVKAAMSGGAASPSGLMMRELPADSSAFWDQLRGLVTLAQNAMDAVLHADMVGWRIGLFVYLMICMTVRMAPFSGNARGHLGAIAGAGVTLALAGTLTPKPADALEQLWPLVSLTVGWLFLLLLISLLAWGIAAGTRMIVRWE